MGGQHAHAIAVSARFQTACVCLRGVPCNAGPRRSAQNKIKINDWSKMQELFDVLNARYEKSKKHFTKPPKVGPRRARPDPRRRLCASHGFTDVLTGPTPHVHGGQGSDCRQPRPLLLLRADCSAVTVCTACVYRHDWSRPRHHAIPPQVYIKLLAELEDSVNATAADKETQKKMSPTNSKAYNTMRQRIKKHNPLFADDIAKVPALPRRLVAAMVHVPSHEAGGVPCACPERCMPM